MKLSPVLWTRQLRVQRVVGHRLPFGWTLRCRRETRHHLGLVRALRGTIDEPVCRAASTGEMRCRDEPRCGAIA